MVFWGHIGNKGYDFFEKDKDKNNILIDNILGILLEDTFRQLILQRIRIKDSLRIFKNKDKVFINRKIPALRSLNLALS